MKLTLLAIILLQVSGCSSPQNEDSNQYNLEVKFWDLPTGSKIAYADFKSKDSLNSIPLIFLHGGPGANQVKHAGKAHKWYKHLTELGFDVYIYDQIGSGLSARLQNPGEYSVKRHVEDLEEIRKITGSKKIILIGDSWGASLAANYIATYPGNVSKVIFTSPGAINIGNWNLKSSTPRLAPEFLNWINEKFGEEEYLHFLKLDSHLQSNLSEAYKFAGDEEMDKLADSFINDFVMQATVRDPGIIEEKNLKMEGMGWWVMIMTTWDATNRNNPALPKLIGNRLPALILRGNYDYLPEQFAEEYSSVFVNSRFIRIKDAGHLIWLEKPYIYTKEIESFLKN